MLFTQNFLNYRSSVLLPTWIRTRATVVIQTLGYLLGITYPRPSHREPRCLQDLLWNAVTLSSPSCLTLYPPGSDNQPVVVEYKSLYIQALDLSHIIRQFPGFQEQQPILIHFDDHWDTILWFWACLLAGGLPAISAPFSNVQIHREAHLAHLSTLLSSPICITKADSLFLFSGSHTLQVHAQETLWERVQRSTTHDDTYVKSCSSICPDPNQAALLMFTSGSTGNAKAVSLSHNQILAALAGKASFRQMPHDKPFLNWIGLDHVAGMVEIHLQAMYLGIGQIHVHPSDMSSSPGLFLRYLSEHQVSRSFAPNFFLAKLASELQSTVQSETSNSQYDLRYLTALASGGEANDIGTCVAASSVLSHYGAPANVITPGFGMTETCAGAIFNNDCPAYDVETGNAFASLGKCVDGIQMRISSSPVSEDAVQDLSHHRTGELQVSGDIVFGSYFRDPEATAAAFTADGWFKTGDQATIDSHGNLQLIGRVKDVININGVKINCNDIQSWINLTLAGQVSRAIVFPSRAANAPTEQITVAYVPKDEAFSAKEVSDLNDQITDAAVICTGHRPLVFLIQDLSLLPQTSLGKISRTKMRSLCEKGIFDRQVSEHQHLIEEYRRSNFRLPQSQAEEQLIQDFAKIIDISPQSISRDTSIFHIGFTSMDLIRLRRILSRRLGIDIPVIELMKHSTASLLASHVKSVSSTSTSDQDTAYNPVVPLSANGSKTPLWVIHPGVGEILVFVGLAQQLKEDDRPVYALRARGFEGEETGFRSISEAVKVYHDAIRQYQPCGPYAIAGYSYGSMLAFEVAKVLEQEENSTVQFLGVFNLPPHIKPRMRQLNRNLCLLHLAYFLGLVTEEFSDQVEDSFALLPHQEAVDTLFATMSKERALELGLEHSALLKWAALAYGLQSMAVDYDPSGLVSSIDVFHARPLRTAAKSRNDWVQNHLSKWREFCSSDVELHAVGGAHYTMIGPDHVNEFATTLQRVLKQRGL